MASISIDPVTRVEGHLAVRVEVEDGKVSKAWTTGEMFRGFEEILRGRDPLDAQQITQRICGVCPVEHGIASILAQDACFGVTPTENGRLLRNIIEGANYLASHITHFYTLSAIDFVDVTAVLSYQGKDAGLSSLKGWVKQQIESKVYLPAAPFLPRYDADYVKDVGINVGLLDNYLRALEVRRICHELGAQFTGKLPHAASLIPGGVSQTVDVTNLMATQARLKVIRQFIYDCYAPDAVAVSQAFPAYWKLGRGCENYMVYGVFHGKEAGSRLFPSGVLRKGKLEEFDAGKIAESVRYSYFKTGEKPLHPSKGETQPDPKKADAYSWVKAPRYEGAVMEVGALARMLVGWQREVPVVRQLLDKNLAAVGRTVADMPSCIGRHLARALESKIVVDAMGQWLDQLKPGQPPCAKFTIPQTGSGAGLTEAARGALGHWIEVRDKKIHRYQCVVPTTWNCSPRDEQGNPGALEQALLGVGVADAQAPIEAVRVVRSFDPCLACAVH